MWDVTAKQGGTGRRVIVINMQNPKCEWYFSTSQFVDFCQLWYVYYSYFKGPIPPRAQLEVVHFLYQMKAHIFLFANPKFQLQILCSFGDITKNVKLNGIPENSFLCMFTIASLPGMHNFFCLWRVNKKLPQGETTQNAFQRSRSIN